MARALKVDMERIVLRVRRRGSAGVRIRMGRLLRGVVLALRWLDWLVLGDSEAVCLSIRTISAVLS